MAWFIAKLVLGAASMATGLIGLWGIYDGDVPPLALVIVLPSLFCGFYTANASDIAR